VSEVSRREFLHVSAAAVGLNAAQQTQREGASLAIFHDSSTLQHEPRAGHPESPRRMDAVMSAVRAAVDAGRATLVTQRVAVDEEILRVHSSSYLNKVRTEIAAGRQTLSTGDTDISRGSLAAALAAAGSVVSATDAVLTGRVRRAFCAVRPPGHHASRDRGMGFCLFNNVAIGVRHAQRRHGVERVLIVDWDVHHGNGTQDVFVADGSVLFFDTHQHPWYPGTGLADEIGTGKGRGLIFNRPLPAGSGRADVLKAFREVLVPAAERFKPQLVFISAGFDSRLNDPLGQFTLSDEDFADLTQLVGSIAGQHAGGRVISVLEGGYSLEGLTRATRAHLAALTA
jgi:acetoin utilization deacetylase AcuC-like enzyme